MLISSFSINSNFVFLFFEFFKEKNQFIIYFSRNVVNSTYLDFFFFAFDVLQNTIFFETEMINGHFFILEEVKIKRTRFLLKVSKCNINCKHTQLLLWK